MSLPDLNLDDRTFQAIVDDTKRRIAQRCPEWTDHNVSDPGVTLVELFAGMIEMMIFRLNQVPEKNYRKYLELIGISLQPPAAAGTTLLFRLARPISTGDDGGLVPPALPAYRTTASTLRTEVDEAIEFVTVKDVAFQAPQIVAVFAAPAGLAVSQQTSDAGIRRYSATVFDTPLSEDILSEGDSREGAYSKISPYFFPIYQDQPETDDCLYIGFETTAGQLLELSVDGLPGAAVGLMPEAPLQVWEAFDPDADGWVRLNTIHENLAGFARPAGRIEFLLPLNGARRFLQGIDAHWIRCRYTERVAELDQYLTQDLRIQGYERSPRIRNLEARCTGAAVPALNCSVVFNEMLGESTGLPGQSFSLNQGPVLELDESEQRLWVLEPTEDGEPIRYEFSLVADFSASTSEDRHFTFDALAGTISFGPTIVAPSGEATQYGAVPPKGHSIVVPRYRIGGGAQGNIRAGFVSTLKAEASGISEVRNIRPAEGGLNRETLEHAKLRALDRLKVQNRAVTAEDFALLAKKALAGRSRENPVGRAHCLGADYEQRVESEGGLPAGTVQVLLIPFLGKDVLFPEPDELHVSEETVKHVKLFLEDRKLLTTRLLVTTPEYVFVSSEIHVVSTSKADPVLVAKEVELRLARFIHPLYGGASGAGWEFGRTLRANDLYSLIADVPGVGFLHDCSIFSSIQIASDGSRSVPQKVDLKEGLRLQPHQVLVSRSHNVRAQAAWEFKGELLSQ